MLLYNPHSRAGYCRSSEAALPDATYELCGDFGVNVAVGFPTQSLVYRGVFDKKKNTGSWAFSYMRDDDEGLVAAPFDLNYSCKMAMLRIQNFIDDYPT